MSISACPASGYGRDVRIFAYIYCPVHHYPNRIKPMSRPGIRFFVLFSIFVLCVPCVTEAGVTKDFANPPREYRPRVWWHWMNGNITREGIRRDLEWMDRSGIVGFHLFDAGFDTPQIVGERLPYMGDGWKDAFNLALDIADSLDMEVSITSSPGWSLTGGPWVSEDDAMKKLSWSETYITGGRKVRRALPEPASVNSYYKDIAVLAVKVPDADLTMEEMGAVTSTGADENGCAWTLITLDRPRPIRAFRVRLPFSERYNYARCLECSDDGVNFRTVTPRAPETVSLDNIFDIHPVNARYFRFRSTVPDKDLKYEDIRLYGVAMVNAGMEKAGYSSSYSIRDFYPTPSDAEAVAHDDVRDVSGFFRDGYLEWKAPEGRWCILRFGYTLTGKKNGPASPEATGLEVDKFDRDAVRRYFRDYYNMYQEASNGRLGSVITNLMIDSYESGCQNWTARMPEEFEARRGYGLLPWMPALAGRVVGSPSATERFLYDWRRTLEELVAENHYDAVDSVNAAYGLTRYTEAQEYSRVYNADGMDVRRHADVPVASFWMREFYSSYPCEEADMREAASVAHIYGQNVCAGESFTTNGEDTDGYGNRIAWSLHPGNLKPAADAAMASGQNRFIIHSTVHQPVDDKVPGLTLGKHGMAFNRNNTWAEESRPWVDYLARSSYLLSQGTFVADLAVFYSETTNAVARFKHERPEVPDGYAYDFINRSVLVSGMDLPYKVIIIDKEVSLMSIPVLRRFSELADEGRIIVGNAPSDYCDLGGSEAEFKALVDDIWHSGRFNVISRPQLETVLRSIGLQKDVDLRNPTGADIRFVHRHLDEGELYWIANINPESRCIDVSFRTSGRKALVLHADDGRIERVPCHEESGRTIVSLHFNPDDAQFILFSDDAPDVRETAGRQETGYQTCVAGPWRVAFQPGRGAPSETVMDRLSLWNDSAEPGIRYFSGTATYTAGFGSDGEPCILDLGEVYNMARVFVNGRDMGLLWKKPFRVDISDAVKDGTNELRIEVTNTWHNRIIGDLQPGVKERISYTCYDFYKEDSPLYDSGLKGPVMVCGW